jgi:aminopeptidase N
VSGIDFTELMDSWTSKMGFPYLKVTSEEWGKSEVKLTLEQRWFLADGTGANEDAMWNIPLIEATASASASASATATATAALPFIGNTRTFSKTIRLSDDKSWVKLNTNQVSILSIIIYLFSFFIYLFLIFNF